MIEHMYPRGAFWPRHLEVVGSELFLRYRKRLMQPWISLEICRDYPGLSIADVLVRVHAGRQIIRDGDEFEALAQIRSGRWDADMRSVHLQADVLPGAEDPFSALLVRLGRGLFAGFVAVSLAAVLLAGLDVQGNPAGGLAVLGLGVLTFSALIRLRRLSGVTGGQEKSPDR